MKHNPQQSSATAAASGADSEQHQPSMQTQAASEGRIFKTLRGDKKDFWSGFAEELVEPKVHKKELRRVVAKRPPYTVKLVVNKNRKEGEDEFIYETVETDKEKKYKIPGEEYNEEDKKLYTRHQSTSFSNFKAGYIPPVFGNNAERADLLVGTSFAPEECKLKRIMMYDGGTHGRRYDVFSKWQGKAFIKEKLAKGLFHTSLASLQKKGLAQENTDVNEVMAKLRWTNNSSITIFTDNLESRLLAQLRAKDLKNRFEKKEKKRTIPIDFYPDFRSYTEEEQKQDLEKAKNTPELQQYVIAMELISLLSNFETQKKVFFSHFELTQQSKNILLGALELALKTNRSDELQKSIGNAILEKFTGQELKTIWTDDGESSLNWISDIPKVSALSYFLIDQAQTKESIKCLIRTSITDMPKLIEFFDFYKPNEEQTAEILSIFGNFDFIKYSRDLRVLLTNEDLTDYHRATILNAIESKHRPVFDDVREFLDLVLCCEVTRDKRTKILESYGRNDALRGLKRLLDDEELTLKERKEVLEITKLGEMIQNKSDLVYLVSCKKLTGPHCFVIYNAIEYSVLIDLLNINEIDLLDIRELTNEQCTKFREELRNNIRNTFQWRAPTGGDDIRWIIDSCKSACDLLKKNGCLDLELLKKLLASIDPIAFAEEQVALIKSRGNPAEKTIPVVSAMPNKKGGEPILQEKKPEEIVSEMKAFYRKCGGSDLSADEIFGKDGELKKDPQEILVTLEAQKKNVRSSSPCNVFQPGNPSSQTLEKYGENPSPEESSLPAERKPK